MVTRSLIAVILSLPASMILIALFLKGTPLIHGLRLPSLLMVFPIWVAIAIGSFVFTKTRTVAFVLIGISLVGYGLIFLLNYLKIGGA